MATTEEAKPLSLYKTLYNLYIRLGFSHYVSDDLAERSSDVAIKWAEDALQGK